MFHLSTRNSCSDKPSQLWIYACEARKQNQHLADSVAQQVLISRPVIIGHGIVRVTSRINNVPSAVNVPFVNFGRSVSPVAVAVGHIFVRDAKEFPPVDPECKGRWPMAD